MYRAGGGLVHTPDGNIMIFGGGAPLNPSLVTREPGRLVRRPGSVDDFLELHGVIITY
jgi:hypothetical protein